MGVGCGGPSRRTLFRTALDGDTSPYGTTTVWLRRSIKVFGCLRVWFLATSMIFAIWGDPPPGGTTRMIDHRTGSVFHSLEFGFSTTSGG